jgi:hypothetical protein
MVPGIVAGATNRSNSPIHYRSRMHNTATIDGPDRPPKRG